MSARTRNNIMLANGYFTLTFLCCYSAVQVGAFVDVVTKIQNGHYANEAEIPYVVSLQNVENDGHFCGGSIITETWVLTAAHCTTSDSFDIQAGQIQVTTGAINSRPWSVHRVTRIRRHERYAKNDSAINDIALLEVMPPFVFGFSVRPVRLPESHLYIPAGTKALVAGWGTLTHPVLTMPTQLQKLDVTIVSENYCKETYMMVLMSIYSVHLCTHETVGRLRGTCRGDSGGPLTINGDTIVGIVSWSRKNGGCGTFPAVYTRVSEFIVWILETMYEG